MSARWPLLQKVDRANPAMCGLEELFSVGFGLLMIYEIGFASSRCG
ncbi:MAG: hypothetical protein WCB68_10430 [Pyrinomonadaceae bacterium]